MRRGLLQPWYVGGRAYTSLYQYCLGTHQNDTPSRLETGTLECELQDNYRRFRSLQPIRSSRACFICVVSTVVGRQCGVHQRCIGEDRKSPSTCDRLASFIGESTRMFIWNARYPCTTRVLPFSLR